MAETPQPRNPPPHSWAHIRGRYWPAKIDDISLWPLINIIPTRHPCQWRNRGLLRTPKKLIFTSFFGVSFLVVLLSLLPLPPGEGAEQNGTARHLLFALFLICETKNLVRQSLTLRGTSYGMVSIQGSILLRSGSGSVFSQWCEAGSFFNFDADPDSHFLYDAEPDPS